MNVIVSFPEPCREMHMFVIKRPQAVKTDRISEMSRKFSLH